MAPPAGAPQPTVHVAGARAGALQAGQPGLSCRLDHPLPASPLRGAARILCRCLQGCPASLPCAQPGVPGNRLREQAVNPASTPRGLCPPLPLPCRVSGPASGLAFTFRSPARSAGSRLSSWNLPSSEGWGAGAECKAPSWVGPGQRHRPHAGCWTGHSLAGKQGPQLSFKVRPSLRLVLRGCCGRGNCPRKRGGRGPPEQGAHFLLLTAARSLHPTWRERGWRGGNRRAGEPGRGGRAPSKGLVCSLRGVRFLPRLKALRKAEPSPMQPGGLGTGYRGDRPAAAGESLQPPPLPKAWPVGLCRSTPGA